MDLMNFILSYSIIFFVLFIIFIIIRSIMLWYWKVDKIVDGIHSLNDKKDAFNNEEYLNDILKTLKSIDRRLNHLENRTSWTLPEKDSFL